MNIFCPKLQGTSQFLPAAIREWRCSATGSGDARMDAPPKVAKVAEDGQQKSWASSGILAIFGNDT